MARPDFAALLRNLGADRSHALPATQTDTRIMDMTVRLLGEHGERRLTIDDVADGARLGRATVFRRFGSKDDLLARVYAREVLATFERVREAADTGGDHVDALCAGYCELVAIVVSHPVVRRIARTEADLLVGQWRDGEPSGLDMLRELLVRLAQERGARRSRRLEGCCDLLARMLFAHVLAPREHGTLLAEQGRRQRVGLLTRSLLAP